MTGSSRRAGRLWIFAGLVALVLVVGLAFRFGPGINDFLNEFLDVDKCMDRGGKWDYDKQTCLFK